MRNVIRKTHKAFSFQLLGLLFSLTLVNAAIAQVKGGTLILVFHSPDKIIFAADSRTTVRSRNGTIVTSRDDECKLLALDDHFIAVIGGEVGIEQGPFKNGDAHAYAREEFAKLRVNDSNKTLSWASAWGKRVKSWLDEMLPTSAAPPGKPLAYGYFGGIERDGALRMYYAELLGPGVRLSVTPDTPRTTGFLEGGFTVLTGRAFDELQREPIPEGYYSRWKDRDAATTVYYTEQTILRAHDPRVGGKVQSIELSRDSQKYEWIRRCPS